VRNEGSLFGIGGDISAVFMARRSSCSSLPGFLASGPVRLEGLGAGRSLIGGALGNLATGSARERDRLHRSASWPTFNLADMAIVVGSAAALDVERSRN